MLGDREDWEEVRHGAERKPLAESGRNRWNDGNRIRYGGGRSSEPAGRSEVHGNPNLKRVVFNVLGNASKMVVRFKINVESCSEYTGSEFKDYPTGAVVVIRSRTRPPNLEPTKPDVSASDVGVIIWKEE